MIYDFMSARRSIRRFKAEAPPRAMLEQLIAAAITAPSASNKQPWRFLMVSNAAVKQQMAALIRAAVERTAQKITPGFEESFRAYGDYFTRFEGAPVVIVPLFRPLTLLSNMVEPGLKESEQSDIEVMEMYSGLVSVSLAVQNLLLMAQELGLGASGMTGPLIARSELKHLLAVPPSWDIAAVIPVGFPDETPDPKPRKPVAQVIKWIE